jgi:hypothetical protein
MLSIQPEVTAKNKFGFPAFKSRAGHHANWAEAQLQLSVRLIQLPSQ